MLPDVLLKGLSPKAISQQALSGSGKPMPTESHLHMAPFSSCVKLLEGNSWKPNIEQERAVVTLESAVYVPRMESILQLS